MSRTAAFAGKQSRFYEITDGSTGLGMANLHYAAAKEIGFEMTYIPKRTDRAGFPALYRELGEGASGLVIAPPFKSDVLMLLDSIDDDARTIGACNVVSCHDGRLNGSNTEWTALVSELRTRGFKPTKNRALVIGSGASSRASLYALWRLGFTRMAMAGRNVSRVQSVVSGLGFVMGVDISAVRFPDGLSALDTADFDIIVNATPLGKKPDEDPLPGSQLHEGMLVMDLALSEGETTLMKRARGAGCDTLGGNEVAGRVAALDLREWLGRPPSGSQLENGGARGPS